MTARYIGMNASTGRQISELEHIQQSLHKILTTPIGSRVMRRDFGSMIPDLIDKPLNGKTRMQVMAACVMAIQAWEPRVDLVSVALQLGNAASDLYADIELARRDGPSAGKTSKLQISLKA